MTTIKIRFHDLLQKKMKRDGRDPSSNPITQDEIAEAIGLGKSTVSFWSRDKVDRLDKEILIKFCDYFECDLCDLLVLER